MARHCGQGFGTARLARAILVLLLWSANGQASADGCSAEVVLRDADAGAPRIALTIRLLDGAGKAHERTVNRGEHRLIFERVGCGPSTLEIMLPADPDRPMLDKPLRLGRRMFQFDDYGRAAISVPVLPIRPVRCRAVDGEKKPVTGGTVGATPLSSDGVSSIAIGARIRDDGFGELLLTKGKHRLTYSDDANFLTKPTTIDGERAENEVLNVDDSNRLVEFVVTRSAPKITVTGRIVDPHGAGLAGIEVGRTERHSKKTETDDSGHFHLEVAANAKTITLQASDPGARWVVDPVTVDLEQEREELKWAAKPWLGSRIKARVIGSGSGEPIVKAHLMADLECLKDTPRRLISILTDERGGFEIPCSPGCPSTVDVYPYWSESPEYFHEQEMSVPVSACGDSWVVHLERGATLSGNVVDKHGHGVSGLHLKLARDGEASVTEWTTGSDGSYSFHPLFPGRYEVQLHEMLEWGEDRFFFLAGEGQPLVPLPFVEIGEQQDIKLDILATAGGMLCVEGVQTPDDSRPLPITWLYAVPADDSDSAGGRVYDLRHNRSSQGGCTLGLPAGKWRFAAGSSFLEESLVIPAWKLTGEPTTATVTVEPGERTVVKALPGQVAGGLAIGLRDYELAITDPVSLEIAHRPDGGAGSWNWLPVPPERYRVAVGPNDKPGVFAMIPPGEYKLRLRVGEHNAAKSTAWVSESAETVVAGENLEITMKRAALDSW